MSDPLTLTLPQAAGLLGIAERSAYRLMDRGEFPVPVIRLGRSVRVSKARLESFVNGDSPAASSSGEAQ